jgi:hypothetical protein
MHKKIYRPLWLIVLAIAITLSCQTTERVREVQETAQNAIEQGKGVIETIRAVATQSGPMLATLRAFATQQAPLLETAKAFATEQGPEMLETVQAAATEFAFGELPADIPVVDRATTTAFVSSNLLVSYTTSLSFASVLDFYKQNMPANGWSAMSGERYETDTSALTKYEKADRVASVSINLVDGQTVVLITIDQ